MGRKRGWTQKDRETITRKETYTLEKWRIAEGDCSVEIFIYRLILYATVSGISEGQNPLPQTFLRP